MKVDLVRCWHCRGEFAPWTNERCCSDECDSALERTRPDLYYRNFVAARDLGDSGDGDD